MKRIIAFGILICLLFSVSNVFAAEKDETSYFQINLLLDNSKKLTKEQILLISDLSSDLSAMQRNIVYESNKQTTTTPLVLNLLLGCGIGSFVQGDTYGGTMGLVLDLLSTTLFYTGYMQSLEASTRWSSDGTEGSELIIMGAAMMLGSKIGQLIRPFIYANEYNKNLSSALMSVSMVPVMDQNKEFGMRVAANISF
ncbi:P13 family porin [Sphaerochaeta globosa]|uniref:Membrane P13 n=1 Tax=Sphaerochaeta globosa (strain ATCC BAA-1886 / DSM 22777 / Buddy) TaxID=158189 RepID=F0RWP8_SPHGB|nr:P13 family porin [Sphaerochaeta globosa]ADY13679.1 membrane P13 [Sphaerochaeta globosa str. Buddy]